MSEGLARRQRGRILTSLMLLLFAVGVVPLLGTSYNLVSKAQETLKLDQEVIQLDKARGLSQQVSIYVQSLRSQVAAIARTLEVGVVNGTLPRIRDSKSLERYVGGDSPFWYVGVVNPEDGRGPGAGFELQDAAIIAALRDGIASGREGRAMMGEPIISNSLQGEPLIVVSEPIMANKKAQGVLVAVATLLPVSVMTKDIGDDKLYQVYVIDKRGRLVAHSDSKRALGVDLSTVDIVRWFLDPKAKRVGRVTTPFTIGTDRGTIKMLGTSYSVPDSDWGVIVQVEEDLAYDAAIQMRHHATIVVGLVTLLAGFLGTVFAGEISRPIQKLAEGARRLAGGDYSTRVSLKSKNEVGVLADAFNQMGDEVEKAIEEVRQAAATNKDLFMGSIRMLANAIDEKDPYTRGHSERVAYYSMVTARFLGMPDEEVEKVHLSGIIHDVGKIGIEDKILRKASALTDDEYEIMKQHPTKGAHILAAVPMLQEMAGAGLQHHENWDGSGYPDGLKGEEIPLLGRIVSVADAFDAMTTDRPYSKAMSFEAAIARLRFLAGKKFDGVCVEAFAKAAEAGEVTPAKARRAAVVARQQGGAGPAEADTEPVAATH